MTTLVKRAEECVDELTMDELIEVVIDCWMESTVDTLIAVWTRIINEGTYDQITRTRFAESMSLILLRASVPDYLPFNAQTEEESKANLEKFMGMVEKMAPIVEFKRPPDAEVDRVH